MDVTTFFTKICTNRKGKSGRAPKEWRCKSCQGNIQVTNPPPSFQLPQLMNSFEQIGTMNKIHTTNKLPPLSGKHKKSGLCDHPDVDFLEMQVVTLKSALAQKELELTKLKQSDALKIKQINSLEAKLQEYNFAEK